jgi:hypothetical protein
MSNKRTTFSLILSAFLFYQLAAGQTTVASITGIVKDPKGAVVPGVTIIVKNIRTNERRTTTTDENGLYRIFNLLPGEYTLRAEQQGFRPYVQSGIALEVAQAARIDIVLQPGEVKEEMVVVGQVPLVNTENANIGTVINKREVLELPLNGRQYLQLAYLVPGAAPAVKSHVTLRGSGPNNIGLQLSGGRASNNSYLIDGIESSGFRFRNTSLQPSIEMIQEFKVQTSPYDPQYGYFSNGQVNVATKLGTNEFHGTVFEFLRNDVFDARNFFDIKKAPFKRNQFGWVLGGPVARDRTFFFAGMEWLRFRRGVTATAQVPTAAERAGDFSADPRPVIDPMTGQPFPNNRIPADRIHPIARTLVNLYPLPNAPFQRPNFVSSESRRLNWDLYNFRLDHNVSDRWRLFGRYTYSKTSDFTPGAIPKFGLFNELVVQNVAFVNTFTFTPNLIAELRLGYNRERAINTSEQVGRFRGTQVLGIQGLPPLPPELDGYPAVNITGFTTIGDLSFAPETRVENAQQIVFNLTNIQGKHTLRAGVDIRPLQFNNVSVLAFNRGVFTFTNFLTGASSGLPEFLLGLPQVAQRTRGVPRADARSTLFAFYVGDDYKVNPRFTINYGIRYELYQPFVDKQNRMSVFVPDGYLDPPRPGQILVAGDPNNGFRGRRNRALYPYTKRNWGPRLGITVDPTGKGKMAIRAGYGIYYNVALWNGIFLAWNNIPFRVDETFRANPAAGLTLSLTAPFPEGRVAGVPGGRNLAVDFKDGYVQQWSFGIQYQLASDLMFDLSYVGSKGTNLDNIAWVNQGAVPGTPKAPYFRPFPNFGTFLTTFSNSNSNYHSLQLQAQKRFSKGLMLISSYTYSHSIDNSPGAGGGGSEQFFPQDPRNLRAERAHSDYDQRHRATFTGIYELPFGPGRPYLNISGFAGKLIGGWQIGGIWTLASGTPWTPRVSGDRSLTGGLTDRPNRIRDGNLPVSQRRRERWFDTGAFPIQPVGEFGNSGRNVIEGPGFNNFDFSLIKKTTITETVYVEFRAEFFNLFNRTNFGGPGIIANAPATFGVISSAFDPRILQFGLKVFF